MINNKLYFLEALLNKSYKEPLQMVNREGENFSFKKIAVKRYCLSDKELIYCVLQPLTKIDDINDKTLLLYRVDIDKRGNVSLHYEKETSIMQDILENNTLLQ